MCIVHDLDFPHILQPSCSRLCLCHSGYSWVLSEWGKLNWADFCRTWTENLNFQVLWLDHNWPDTQLPKMSAAISLCHWWFQVDVFLWWGRLRSRWGPHPNRTFPVWFPLLDTFCCMEGRLLPAAAVLLQLCGKDQHSGYTAYTGRLETLRWGETGEALKRTLRKKGGALLGSWKGILGNAWIWTS